MAVNELKDVTRPLDLKQLKRGWYETREYDYWIPEADVEGRIPVELYGTLLRNGPGLLEVYGKKLQHRKLPVVIIYCGGGYDDNIICLGRISLS